MCTAATIRLRTKKIRNKITQHLAFPQHQPHHGSHPTILLDWNHEKGPRTIVKSSALRPLRLRSLLLLTVYLEVDLLVEETQVLLHLGSFGYGIRVTPDEVLDELAACFDQPVRRD